MANATCIATNFFHGCIFALKNRKPFVTELSTPRRDQGLRSCSRATQGAGKAFAGRGFRRHVPLGGAFWRTIRCQSFFSHRRAAGALELLLGPCSCTNEENLYATNNRSYSAAQKQIVHSATVVHRVWNVRGRGGRSDGFRSLWPNPDGRRLGDRTAGLRASFPPRCPFSPSASLIACPSHTRGSSCASAWSRIDEPELASQDDLSGAKPHQQMESRMSWLAARSGYRTLYIDWARLMTTLHGRLAWSQGRFGSAPDKLG